MNFTASSHDNKGKIRVVYISAVNDEKVKASHWMKKHVCFQLSIFMLWRLSNYPETEYFAVILNKFLEHQKMPITLTVYQTSGSTYT